MDFFLVTPIVILLLLILLHVKGYINLYYPIWAIFTCHIPLKPNFINPRDVSAVGMAALAEIYGPQLITSPFKKGSSSGSI